VAPKALHGCPSTRSSRAESNHRSRRRDDFVQAMRSQPQTASVSQGKASKLPNHKKPIIFIQNLVLVEKFNSQQRGCAYRCRRTIAIAAITPCSGVIGSMCLFVPESKRVHGIIKCVISPDKMTSTPSKIISSSVNNLTVWDGERAPIPYSFHLFGIPCRYRIPHIYQ
jgi:hypothetical protein